MNVTHSRLARQGLLADPDEATPGNGLNESPVEAQGWRTYDTEATLTWDPSVEKGS